MSTERPTFSVFFAWQDDVDQAHTTNAIRPALKVAINRLEEELPIRIVLDEATREVCGAPYIPFEIARKIQAADVFVGDITSVFQFPDGGKSLPNSNVAFETGVAAAHLGWNRMVLLFSTQSAKFENLPFDFDRHRISKYALEDGAKKLEGRIEPLASLLVDALRLIAAERPKRPHELVGKSAEEIKKSRDEENIRWFMKQFSVPLLGIHVRDAPELLNYFAPYMCDNMREVLSRADFKLYDQRALDLIQSLTDALDKTLAFDHLYRELNNNLVQAFGRKDQYRDLEEEMKAAGEIRAAALETRRLLDELVDYVRLEYIAIDTDETSVHAENVYYKSIGQLVD